MRKKLTSAPIYYQSQDTHENRILAILSVTKQFSSSIFHLKPKRIGSSSRTRTCDQLINSQLLYRLSYRGIAAILLFAEVMSITFTGRVSAEIRHFIEA